MEPNSPDLAARLEALAARRAAAAPAPAARPSSTSRSKRRHPARGARTAALGLSLASTGTLSAIFAIANPAASQQQSSEAVIVSSTSTTTTAGTTATPTTATPTTATPATTTTSTTATAAAPATTTTSTTATAAAPATSTTVTTVDGATFTNKWGDVQVQATFAADGSLVDVTVLQSPDADHKSVEINNRAIPTLNSEALAAQSAAVDTVSGATYTSTGYQQSLQSAIDAAREADLTTLA